MSSRAGKSFDPRKAALALAVAFAAISAGVVLYFIASGRSAPESTVAAAPPSIGEPPPDAPPAAGSGGAGIGNTGWARLQFVDKKDPSRIASEMEWQSLSPDEAQRGRSHISEPRFWIYPDDGQTIHVQAKQATVFMPDQQSEPESGRLYGGALIRVFGPGEDGQRRAIDLEKDTPEVLIATETITFDSALGEIGMPTTCDIELAQGRFRAANLRLNVNEVQRRLELLEAGPGEMRYSLAKKRDERPRPERPAGAAPAEPGAESPAPAAPREDLYRATFTGNVAVRHATREVTGDALDVWARLLGGALPENAFPRVDGGASAVGAAPAAPTAGDGAAVPTPAGDAPPAAPAPDEDVVLTWKGTLVIRPIPSTPPELQNQNHLALRFTADTTGNVTFADTDAGINGACVWAGLAITTQDLTLAGPGPAAVRITTRGGQEMIVPRLDLNLLSGIGMIRGAGVMNDGDRRLHWAEQCDLVFATRKGLMTGSLREAAFRGEVTARDERSSMQGDLLRARFVPAPDASDRNEKVALAAVLIEGNAAGTSKEGSIRADRIDVAFDTAKDGDPQPKIVTATGSVRASNGEATLRGGFVEATLAKDEGGNPVVTDLLADGDARLESLKEQLAAGADRLRYDGVHRAARLEMTGNIPAWVSQERTKISSAIIDLDEAAGRLNVPGAGTFEHQPAPGSAGPLGDAPITAAWSGSLVADRQTGIIDCTGDVVVGTDPTRAQVYRATGTFLRLEIEPEGQPTPEGSAAGERKDRRLLRARLESSDVASPALIESRTYAAPLAPGADPEARTLEQFLRLTGARILADDTAGTGGVISVPGPGRAAVFDGRSSGVKAPDAADMFAGNKGFSGSALFTWSGSMDLDRPTELLTMRRGVRLVHRPLTDDAPTTLECERLKATLLFKPGSKGRDGGSADLVRAEAAGAVYVESAVRRLLADAVLFDAKRKVVEATASEGNRVTLYDDQRATTTSAARLIWDQASNRIDIEKPSPVITPFTPR